MTDMIFKSNHQPFLNKHAAFKDFLMGHMAMDIEVALKTTAGMPVSNTKASGNKRGGGGHMKSETRHFRNPFAPGFRVEIDKAYAAYQERGVRKDGTHIVKHYTTAGTSAHFFRRAIDAVERNKSAYVSEAKMAVGL